MLGSIIGDIAGSSYEVDEILARRNKTKVPYEERIKILDKSVPLFNKKSSYTDDSVLTCAIADALLSDRNYERALKEYGKKEINLGQDSYGRSRFGSGFLKWVQGSEPGESYGNGSAMRIAPVGFYFENLSDVVLNSRWATIPSHNNEDSLKAATATAISCYLAKNNYSKEEIKKRVEKILDTNLDFDLEYLQKNYVFTSKAIDSVPQAIYCFLISNGFEDCIRKSISIGGDTDTIACIAGGIAEAYYGIPQKIKDEVKPYIPEYISKVVDNFYSKIKLKNNEKV
jgi:ADP-ribosylglycohydrolase